MINSRDLVDPTLQSWDNIKGEHYWSGILIGNGASCNIWDGFRYPSLYEKAARDISHPLSQADQEIFTAMDTPNFEAILASLATTEIVCKALNLDYDVVSQHYESIQQALIDAVHAIHIPWAAMPQAALERIRSALRSYQFVYSTNYDLLLYWAIMAGDTSEFRDYLWGDHFDIANTTIFGEATRVLYVHGALHLIRLPLGGTRKLTAQEQSQGDLLSQFGKSIMLGESPLFITEGTYRDKLNSIYQSDYLLFAYRQFAAHRDRLVIFGQSLEEHDNHLVQAIRQWGYCTIAVSMRQKDQTTIMANKTRWLQQLPQARIMFFDAETHPLGDPNLRIPRNGDNNL